MMLRTGLDTGFVDQTIARRSVLKRNLPPLVSTFFTRFTGSTRYRVRVLPRRRNIGTFRSAILARYAVQRKAS